MKSQRGITLTSLVVYIVGITILVSVMAIITTNFYKTMNDSNSSIEPYVEYTKFNTYFTPTRYRNILSESIDYELITFDEAKEYFEQGSTICTFADGVTAETVVDPNFDVIMLNKHDTPDAKIVKEKTYYHYNECH